MTAYAARYSKAELLEAGGDELVTKPVDFTRLALVVSRLMVKNAFVGSPTERRTEPRFETNTPVKVSSPDRRVEERKESDLECHVEFDEHSLDSRLKDISKRGARLELRDADQSFAASENHPFIELYCSRPRGQRYGEGCMEKCDECLRSRCHQRWLFRYAQSGDRSVG